MKSKIKYFLKRALPPLLTDYFKLIDYRKKKYYDEDITELKASLSLESFRAVVIGNGPSLNLSLKKNLNLFLKTDCFCVNEFVLSDYYEIIKPRFYVFADPDYWNPDASGEFLEKVYDNLNFKTKWNIFILMPRSSKNNNRFKDLPSKNHKISIKYFNDKPYPFEKGKRFQSYAKNFSMPQAQTVLVAALFLALNLGYKTIFLTGADLSMHESIMVNEKNILCYKECHFYDNKVSYRPFWKSSDKKQVFNIEEIFYAFFLMFKGFNEIEQYSTFLKSKIYNSSEYSYIDSFERYCLESNN